MTPSNATVPDTSDDGWILVSTSKTYTPCELDISHCLQLRVMVRYLRVVFLGAYRRCWLSLLAVLVWVHEEQDGDSKHCRVE